MRSILSFLVALLFTAYAYANPALHGAWSAANVNGRPLLVQFDPGGAGKINGQPMQWQTLGKLLFIQQNGQVATYGFEAQGDKLQVSGGDLAKVETLTKGSAAYDAAIKAQPKQQAAAKGGAPAAGGGNGQELVGKWCDMHTMMSQGGGGSSRMACFELRPDGSYTYNAESSRSVAAGSTASQSGDSGRWSYSNGQLVAQSRSGQTHRYSLEKRNHPKNKRDPMICLNGTCYVTYYNKPAWQ